MTLQEWAERWRIHPAALAELAALAMRLTPEPIKDRSEAYLQSQVRVAAAKLGWHLFRNNIGAGKLESGNFVRFGLGNDSAALNRAFKSGDLVGWRPVVIKEHHIGCVIAQFVSVECKRGDWKWSGTLEEHAQLAWATIIGRDGGHAIITNDPNRLTESSLTR